MTTIISKQDDGTELIPSSCIISCEPKPSNTFAEHILEDGSTVIDNKITNNAEIVINLVLPEIDPQTAFNAIQTASENTEELIVQTKFYTYTRMYIQSYPWSETAEMISTSGFNPADADTVDRGEQLPKSETILSQAGRWFGV